MSMDDDSITKLIFGWVARSRSFSSVDAVCIDDTSNGSPLNTAFKRSQIEMSTSDKQGARVKLAGNELNGIKNAIKCLRSINAHLISVFGVEKSLLPVIVVVCLITTLISGRFGSAPLD